MPLSKLLFSFQGRIPRSTYWYYCLAYSGLLFIATKIDSAMGTSSDYGGCLVITLGLIGTVTGLAISVKRAHDRDHSGWFVFVGLIPFIGGLWLLIDLGFLRGTVGPNKYGDDPIAAPPLQAV